MRIGVHDQRSHELSVERLLTRLKNRLRIAAKDAAEVKSRSVTPAGAVKERQEQLLEFYRVYEELVEALCDAAQYGPTPGLEAAYGRGRVWMNEHYPSIRRYVVAYLQYATEDAVANTVQEGEGADAFEALVAAPDLAAFLEKDDGLMISRLHRTRQALNLYAEHLRQLARAVA